MNRQGDMPTSERVATAPEEFNVKIVGHQHISKKLFEIIMHLLIDYEVVDYKAVNEIVFSADEPKKFGAFDVDTRKILINLQKHFDSAVDMAKDEALSTLSLRSHLWFGLLTTIIHEIIHAMSFAIDPEKTINGDKEAIEEEVSKETSARIRDLIRDYDVEPPSLEDEPFFGSRYMEFYVKSIKENSEQWAINQNALHDTGFIFKADEMTCSTFREWYRSAYEHAGDTKWDKDTEPLLKVEVGYEPIPLPVGPVEDHVVEKEPTKVAEPTTTPVEEQKVEIAPLPEGLDPETLALLDMDEQVEVNMEKVFTPMDTPAPTVAQVAPSKDPAPVQQELPLKQPAPSGICRSCNAALAEGAKFCSTCGTSAVETPMPVLPTTPAPSTTTLPTTPQPPAQNTQFSYGAKRAMRTDLPNYNLSPEQIRACVGEVFIRCYQHIFSKCGWSPGQNPSFAAELRNAVQEPISVVGIPCIDQLLIGMDSVDSLTGNFTWSVPPVNGMIRGKITKNLGLPSYTLYFNFNGHEAKRLIMPQNQWKVSGQGYSGPAQRAQQGAMIVWLMDGDDSATGQKWRAKIENGTLEWLI